jgi:glycosyltransferase involved in cell wall biosynthesis
MHDPTAGKPLISVIITSYNYLRFITTAIDSARAQTYPNLEIVVVDNCSTDGTVPALRERYAGDPRVRIYENERNLGELLNSNRGFEHSTGAFVMWLSADDWMYPQHLARSHRLFERAPQLDVVYSGAYFADEAGTVYTQRMPEAIFPFDYVDARDELVEMFTTTCPMCWPTALFRRSVFLDVGLEHPEDGIHATDWEMQIRIALAGKRFGYLVEPSLAIRIHEAQQTGAGYHTGGHRLTDLLLMFEKYIDHPGLERLRGREAAVAGFFGWVVDDTIAASGRDVFPPEVHARIATVKRVFEERAARYEPAQVHERKISVVLASTRSPVLTARAIASVAAQTHPNWEIVLVDAGALPLESWLDGLPERERISYVRATMPLTPGGRRNLALRMARGEYLAFLGESNVYAPGHLAALADAIARSGARAAASAARLVLELYDPRFLNIEQIGEIPILRGIADPPDLSQVADALPLDALLVYRSFRDRIGGFANLPVLDDFEFVIRVERDGAIAFAPEPTVEVRVGIDLGPLGPNLPRYVATLDAVYNIHAAPHLAAARASHRSAVERAIATVTANTSINAQGAAELLATLAGRAVRPLLA